MDSIWTWRNPAKDEIETTPNRLILLLVRQAMNSAKRSFLLNWDSLITLFM